MKRYLKTIEDIEALRNTDTKIYNEDCDTKEIYYQFVNGVLCEFVGDGVFVYNTYLTSTRLYIEVEEEPKGITDDDIGQLCRFWDTVEERGFVGFLTGLDLSKECPYEADEWECYRNCRLLTKSEVEKYTRYKVVKED